MLKSEKQEKAKWVWYNSASEFLKLASLYIHLEKLYDISDTLYYIIPLHRGTHLCLSRNESRNVTG